MSVMDHGDRFYIRANAGARDFKIVAAPRERSGRRELARSRRRIATGRFIADATLFKDYLVALEREDSRPRLVVHELASGEAHDIAFEEETYALESRNRLRIRHAASPLPLFVDERGPRRPTTTTWRRAHADAASRSR